LVIHNHLWKSCGIGFKNLMFSTAVENNVDNFDQSNGPEEESAFWKVSETITKLTKTSLIG
jgi:hypothetical protein